LCPSIVDLHGAMAFVDMHGDRTQLWVAAETAIRCADHNPGSIVLATITLEDALYKEDVLD
jgi:hypothetical protein